jgi:hypothetical protein
MKLLVVQASASWAIFVIGNLICLLAALPVSTLSEVSSIPDGIEADE